MIDKSVCRVCLARNTKMQFIADTPLQTIFEKLLGTQLITEDGKPVSICYICHALFRKCWKLQDMSKKSESLLTEILQNDITLVQEKVPKIWEKYTQALTKSKTKCVSMPEYIKYENADALIKEEIRDIEGENSIRQTEADPAAEISKDANDSMRSHTLKEELDSPECNGDSRNTLYPSAFMEKGSTILSKGNNHRQNTKVRKKKLKKTDTEKLLYACEICSKSFKHNNNLKKHMKRHKDLKSFTKCDLQIHNLEHIGKPNICDKCGKAFITKYSLKIHITQKHMRVHPIQKTYECDRCNKSFNHRGTLRLHMRIHTGDKPFSCEKCSKTFSQKGTLQRHIIMHSGQKPYACDKCTKTFNQESSLKRHIKMHTGIKPYACKVCGKAYYESSHLTRHIRTHTGEKPYACDRCFQTFAQSSNLQAHMKKHTGQTPSNYMCFECNKTFDHKSIYKRHLLKHTREKPYPCDRCDKKYADKRTLQRHILTHNLSD